MDDHQLTLHHRMPYFSTNDAHCIRQENKTEKHKKGPFGRIMTTPTMWMDASVLVLVLAAGWIRLDGLFPVQQRVLPNCAVLDCTVAKLKFRQPALDAENLAPAHRSAA